MVTVNVPALDRVAVPISCVAVFEVREALGTVQGVQVGPLNETKEVLGSKPVPVMVNVNDCPATGEVGEVAIVLI